MVFASGLELGWPVASRHLKVPGHMNGARLVVALPGGASVLHCAAQVWLSDL